MANFRSVIRRLYNNKLVQSTEPGLCGRWHSPRNAFVLKSDGECKEWHLSFAQVYCSMAFVSILLFYLNSNKGIAGEWGSLIFVVLLFTLKGFPDLKRSAKLEAYPGTTLWSRSFHLQDWFIFPHLTLALMCYFFSSFLTCRVFLPCHHYTS